MNREEFEKLLDMAAVQLDKEAKSKNTFTNAKVFENRVREVLESLGQGIVIDYDPHPYVFPDIAVGEFGIEVKFTANDSWRSVANSVFETTRSQEVIYIYIIFAKMGGEPAVRWGRYDDCVMHVRTSHVPRFELEMYPEKSLFDKIGITYQEFSKLPIEEKMRFIRRYARERLKPGERLWWLEEKPEQEHSLPIQATLYTSLPTKEKRKLRAEAALLCPQIVGSAQANKKYADVALYILTYHGVICSQVRDLFSAGSVALARDDTRGGNYVERGLLDIEKEMRAAAERLEDALFVEYWGESVPPEHRIKRWLELADGYASNWCPSEVLFLDK